MTWLAALALAFALSAALSRLSQPKEVRYALPHQFAVRDATFFSSAHALADPVPVPGNRIQALENGVEIFPAMLSAIASARHTIHLESYIFSGRASWPGGSRRP